MVLTETPGAATARSVAREGGRHEAWVAGSFGRPVEAYVDGRKVGEAAGANNLGQWLPAGTVSIERGLRRLRLERPGGNLAPGDGYKGELGPLVLEPAGRPERLEHPRLESVRELCSSAWDWLELVEES
jgi:hypothetical protein